MVDHIRLFETASAFTEAYANDYVEPWVSYVLETSGVAFNKSVPQHDYSMDYLTFEILSGGDIGWRYYVEKYGEGTVPDCAKTIEYRVNNGQWNEITSTEEGVFFAVETGDIVEFRGDNKAYGADDGVSYFFINSFDYEGNLTTAVFNVYGNIMSLVNSTDFTGVTTLVSAYTFDTIFSHCTGLTSAENLILPATTLTDFCYEYMFEGCESLTTVPSILPATTVADYSYAGLFYNCTSLVTVPSDYLPASIVGERSYNAMFMGCTSLTTAPELPATTLGSSCYEYMFSDCTSLTTAPELPATALAEQCYCDMFYNCSSLTMAPELPATTLAVGCYYRMFGDCTSLTTAPELPAATLTINCYWEMFKNCTNLNQIKCLATDISASQCTDSWVYNVASSGTFVKNPNMSSWTTGNDGIPSNWTVQDAS